ncbi:MAG: AAA family ATPase [Myxococcales bacterium]|nr:AAA family ATPase [Myxococcales bacterium]
MVARFALSPSRIARFFFHECERHLRFSATPKARRGVEGVPEVALDESPVTASLLEGGYQWEERVVERHLAGRVRVSPGPGALRTRVFEAEATLEALATLQPGEYLYQPTLIAPPGFLARYKLDPAWVSFAPCRPDLIACVATPEGPRLRVVDVKASDTLKASHRVQVTLYALMLREIVRDAGLALEVDLEHAAIWLFEAPQPELVALRLTLGVVESFLSDRVASVLEGKASEAAWHLHYRCEWCEYYDHCRAEAEATRSVSLVPYLTVGGRVHLRQLRPDAPPVETLDQLAAALDDDPEGRSLDPCGSLRGKRDRLVNAVEALRRGEPMAHGGSSIKMPVGEHVLLAVTVHREPLGGRLYAAGFLRIKGKRYFGTGSQLECFVAERPDEVVTLRRAFVRALYSALSELDGVNRGLSWRDQATLQTYVYDSFEADGLHDLLYDTLNDDEVGPEALALMFHFQSEGVLRAERQPGVEVPYPVVTLSEVLRDLIALPTPVAYHLAEVSAALPNPQFSFTYSRSKFFDFALSNQLKSDAIMMLWRGDRPDAAGWIERRLAERLRAVNNLVSGLRERLAARLFAWPPKFFLPVALAFVHPALSRIAFVTRYEALVTCLASRTARARPQGEREREGARIRLQHEADDRWRVLNPLDDALVELDGYWDRLVTSDSDEGERAQLAFDDFLRRKHIRSLTREDIELGRIVEKTVDPRLGLVTHLTLERGGVDGLAAPPPPGARRALHPRVTDFNTDKICARLQAIDGDPGHDFLALLRDPNAFSCPVAQPPAVARALEAERTRAGLTPSQGRAFEHLVRRRLTLVWGPPGTGKTHFLVASIVRLARAHAAASEVFRVAVCAFTHAAVENLLSSLAAQLAREPEAPSIAVRKLDSVRTPRGLDLEALSVAESAAFNEHPLVLGGTVHGLSKAIERSGCAPFSLLIIDEASQMKFGELALASSALGAGARLVLAGDDLQLPPILKGRYPSPDDGLPGLQDSVFAWLRARQSPTAPFTCQLEENWRMHETLSRFSAETLYSLRYRPATAAIAAQRIAMRGPSARPGTPLERLIEALVDPEKPWSLAVIDGLKASTENRAEAELTARVAVALRTRMLSPGGEPYPDTPEGDADFWRHGLFVVSPHRAQIRAIRSALAQHRPWAYAPFVDTVDKMQGQEALAVVVSYGVSDAETAALEAEFIYSLPRLNVSVSRARARCVVFLSRALLGPSFDLLSNPEAARGIAHMHDLLAFVRSGGPSSTFALDELVDGQGATLTLYRR